MSDLLELGVKIIVVILIGGVVGKVFQPFVQPFVQKWREGRGKEKGQDRRTRYFLCTSCLQSYIQVPRGCKDCGGDRFLEVVPTGRKIDLNEGPSKITFTQFGENIGGERR